MVYFQLLLAAFRKSGSAAIELGKKKQKERDEAEKKRLESIALKKKREEEDIARAAANVASSGITELTDEEAEKMQKEIDEEK